MAAAQKKRVELDHRKLHANTLSYYGTPESIVRQMIGYAWGEPEYSYSFDKIHVVDEDLARRHPWRVLEPSAGLGAIALEVRECQPNATIRCVELDVDRAKHLSDDGFETYQMDFLEYHPAMFEKPEDNPDGDLLFDTILMNPPFAGDTYIKHIMHAWELLSPNGMLIALAPPSFTFSSRLEWFKDFVNMHGWYDDLPKQAFKDSGAGNITVKVIRMQKFDQSWRMKERDGFINWHCSVVAMHWTCDSNMCSQEERLHAALYEEPRAFDLIGDPTPHTVDIHIRPFLKRALEYTRSYDEPVVWGDPEWKDMIAYYMVRYNEYADYRRSKEAEAQQAAVLPAPEPKKSRGRKSTKVAQ